MDNKLLRDVFLGGKGEGSGSSGALMFDICFSDEKELITEEIVYNGATDLPFCEQKMSFAYYQEPSEGFDVPCHWGSLCKIFYRIVCVTFLKEEVPLLHCIRLSSNFNLTENLWGVVIQKIYHGGRFYNNPQNLKNGIKVWALYFKYLQLFSIDFLFMSFPKVSLEVIRTNGGHCSIISCTVWFQVLIIHLEINVNFE